MQTRWRPFRRNLSPPPFRAAWWTLPGSPVGGDLQTLIATRDIGPMPADRVDRVDVGEDGDRDQIALHLNRCDQMSQANVLLIHGITGCHAAPYMKRLAARFLSIGMNTYRMDARGCGILKSTATTITHAGRGRDVAAAMAHMATDSPLPIVAIGVSLGGNQLLQCLGKMQSANWIASSIVRRVKVAAAIAPPVDLDACAANMQRRRNHLYNRYFVASLMRRIPHAIVRSPIVQQVKRTKLPRTLREFDGRVTAPLGGFANVDDYYRQSSAAASLANVRVPTLILASQDDPIVPAATFQQLRLEDESALNIEVTRRGGHAGFLGPRGTTWLDDRLADWVQDHLVVRSDKANDSPQSVGDLSRTS